MDNDYILTPDGELVHWGIVGMKWGQRRFQNKDGSLTPAGRKRLKAESDKLKEREAVIKNKERVKARNDKLKAKKAELDARQKALDDAAKAEKASKLKGKKGAVPVEKPKSVKDMTDDELNKAVNRARLETEYNRLHPKKESLLSKLGEKTLNEVLIPSAMTAGKSFLEKALSGKAKEKEPTIDDLLKKYGDMSESERERYKNAAMTKGWENTILGKKNK